MASIKVKFRPSTTAGKEGTIYYQIIQNRVIRQLKTDFRLFTHEWNNKNNSIIIGSDNRYDFLQSIQERINWVLHVVAVYRANILTIHQSIPVNGVATLTLSVEVREDTGNVSSMIDELEVLDGIHYVKILARE